MYMKNAMCIKNVKYVRKMFQIYNKFAKCASKSKH